MLEFPSPDKQLTANWRSGGEMWMSGPEWGYLSLATLPEIKGALSEILWSDDSKLLAFVKLHVEDVPSRQGAEGFSFRVGVIRMLDGHIRYCIGNKNLSEIKLLSLTTANLTLAVGGRIKSVDLRKIQWANNDEEA